MQDDNGYKEETIDSTILNALDFVTKEVRATDNLNLLSVEAIITLLVLNIVEHSTEVKVSITKSIKSVILEYDVNSSDVGRLLGKNGHTIKELRSFIKSVAGDSPKDYFVYLLKDNASSYRDAPRNRRPMFMTRRKSYNSDRY